MQNSLPSRVNPTNSNTHYLALAGMRPNSMRWFIFPNRRWHTHIKGAHPIPFLRLLWKLKGTDVGPVVAKFKKDGVEPFEKKFKREKIATLVVLTQRDSPEKTLWVTNTDPINACIDAQIEFPGFRVNTWMNQSQMQRLIGLLDGGTIYREDHSLRWHLPDTEIVWRPGIGTELPCSQHEITPAMR